jgi:hypothetical protein
MCAASIKRIDCPLSSMKRGPEAQQPPRVLASPLLAMPGGGMCYRAVIITSERNSYRAVRTCDRCSRTWWAGCRVAQRPRELVWWG